MSDQKLVSPLLDGFIMGDAMSSHDGVRCHPAMRENSDDKYIVKIISVPANQRQLDALLLTGAYKDAAAATEYFKELADGVVKEAKLLQHLSTLEGFLPYERWQVVPMEDNKLGYDVYLLGTYKHSLEKYLRRNTMTHLAAVNLGLDLCSALSICRRAGFIHVDLKPSNIFLSNEREYRIGDLGFAKLSSLKYSSLPNKYRSLYTPPELHDEMATLNPTADIYAVGLILYRIFNNNELPFSDQAPDEVLPAPANADYEMAEIIAKACHPNPRHRWQTPIEMGQALVSYMQRNTVNDVPIVPPAAEPPAADAEEAAPAEGEAAEAPQETHEELAFLNDMVSDETAPSVENGDDQVEGAVTDEGSDLLTQADELLTYDTPAPAEEPAAEEADKTEAAAAIAHLDIPDEDDEDEFDLSALIGIGSDRKAGTATLIADDEDDYDDDDDDEITYDTGSVGIRSTRKKKGRGWIAVILILLLLAMAGGGAYYYYTTYYLLPIDNMEISTFEDTITVNLTTAVDESLLTVVCTDTYGNTMSQPVTGGQAVFTDLNSDTHYEITVQAADFHQTSNSNTGSCTTAKQTELIDFTAKTGNEDGSVILNFTVDGPETQDWVVEYSAEGEETQSVTFTGHMVSITGLTLDKVYTFKLLPASAADLWIVGTNTLEYTASKIVVAEDLSFVSFADGVLSAQWSAPADATVESWIVRCYSEEGFDQTVTVTEPSAQFSDVSADQAYTVEVTAAGMTQCARAYVTANPITISDIQVSGDDKLTVSWNYSGNAPEGGWRLMYSVDGGKNSDVVKCSDASGVIELVIPRATYQLTIQAADGSTVFGGTTEYTRGEAEAFDQYSLSNDEIMISLCQTPDKEDWTYRDVDNYPSTYSAGTKVSMVLYATAKFYTNNEDVKVTFIIRDSDGNVRTDLMGSETRNWRSMWKSRYAYLDIPAMPTEAGDYTVDLYFNDSFVLTKKFAITE